MKNKRFLIIEEDDAVRSFLQRTITGVNPLGEATAEAAGGTAMDQIASREFDVIIADLEVIQSAGYLWGQMWDSRGLPQPTLVATSYTESQTTDSPLPIQHLLAKPIHMAAFEQLLAVLLEKDEEIPGSIPDLAQALYGQVNALLDQLQADTSARCILLCDPAGRVIHMVGDTAGLAVDSITSLLSGGIATLLEAGKNLDEQGVINLAYREGQQSDLYAVNIQDDWILIVVIDRGPVSQRLGTVWFYARRAVGELNRLRVELEQMQSPAPLDSEVNQAYDDELDKLFQ
ncbi:MAG TPA: hypothetical protein VF813_01955 [Anaerolineaceae bacterium]